MEVPLGQASSVVVSQEYVRYLVQIANEKMEANRKRTDGLLHALRTKVWSSTNFLLISFYSNRYPYQVALEFGLSMPFSVVISVLPLVSQLMSKYLEFELMVHMFCNILNHNVLVILV